MDTPKHQPMYRRQIKQPDILPWIRERWKLPRFIPLCPREKDVLIAYWIGESRKETADRLGLSPKTVDFYRYKARLKMRAPHMLAAVKRALRYKAIAIPRVGS